MEKKLKERTNGLVLAKEYTDNIIKSMIDTLFVVDPDAKIKTINKATSDLLGYSEDELIGKPVETIFAEEDDNNMPFKGAKLKRLIEEGSIKDYDLTYRTKSGEKIPVSFSGSVMRQATPDVLSEQSESKDLPIIGIVGIARDMREIKRLMEKEKEIIVAEKKRAADLDAAYRELEKSQDASLNIMERSERQRKELDMAYQELKSTQEELVQSEKLAVMGRLIADVSHEINNPLAIIAGNTYLLEGMVKEQVTAVPDLADSARMFEKIKKATNRCKNIVASLLVSTRPTILDIKPTDMNKLIEESLEFMDDRLKSQNVKAVKAFTPRLPIIEADGYRLSQVFINMFTNACDAMPEGGKLRIATRLHTPEAGGKDAATGNGSPAIEVEISDTGEGIGEGDLFKIFDPFVTTKMDGKGVGLGLSISSGIVREHGGGISVTSEKGKGATFLIMLPVKGGRA